MRIRCVAVAGLAAGVLSVACVSVSAQETLTLKPDTRFFTAPPGNWAGLYVGGGLATQRSAMKLPGGNADVVLDDSGTGSIDFRQSFPLNHTKSSVNGFVLGSALLQADRFAIGIEADRHFNAKSATELDTMRDCPLGVFRTGNYGCAAVSSSGGFETKGHIRGLVGVEVTPTMMAFVTAGVAFGQSLPGAVQTGYLFASSPSAPIVPTFVTYGYDGKAVTGTSIGGGAQIKVNDSVVARFEYLRDTYSLGIVPAGGVSNFAIGTVTGNVNASTGDRVTYTNQIVRGSLSYRLGPTGPAQDTSKLGNNPVMGQWGGFYVGGGVTHSRNTMRLPEGRDTLSVYESMTSSYAYQHDKTPERKGEATGFHVLGGFLVQKDRFIGGVEFDREFKNEFDYTIPPLPSGNLPVFLNNPGPAVCGTTASGASFCAGGRAFGWFQTNWHLRMLAGFEVTPSAMVFGSFGLAHGEGAVTAVSNGGIVTSSPSAPLLGKATVSRDMRPESILGTTIGGGAQFKMTENILLRAEYLRDRFGMTFALGGSGFGGTIGTVTTNAFISSGSRAQFINETLRASMLYRF